MSLEAFALNNYLIHIPSGHTVIMYKIPALEKQNLKKASDCMVAALRVSGAKIGLTRHRKADSDQIQHCHDDPHGCESDPRGESQARLCGPRRLRGALWMRRVEHLYL